MQEHFDSTADDDGACPRALAEAGRAARRGSVPPAAPADFTAFHPEPCGAGTTAAHGSPIKLSLHV
jgi:hypothetical protein